MARRDPDPFDVRTVLIADDESDLRRLVRATLAPTGCRVLEASDGDEAWTLLLRHRPAIALLDVRMPGRSGLELVRAIKAEAALAGAYVVLLTADSMEADVRAGLAAGADRYLTKPFSPAALLALVEHVLGTDEA